MATFPCKCWLLQLTKDTLCCLPDGKIIVSSFAVRRSEYLRQLHYIRYWSHTAERYSAISSISGRIHGSRRRIWIQTEDCVPSFVTLPRTKQVFVTKIISINLQIHAYRWCEYAFWHCPVIKRSGAVDTLLISIVESNNGVIFTPDIQRRCQNCWQAVQQCGDVAL